MSNEIKIIKDQAGRNANVEGIDVDPIPVNAYVCGVDAQSGGITIFRPQGTTDEGTPAKIMDKVHYTNFIKSDNSIPISAADLKADIDAQLTQEADTDVNVGYKGVWNADTNTPDLDNLDYTPENGNWYYVSNEGTYEGVSYVVNDVIKYDGTDWQRVPTAENWTYVPVTDSYDITSANNRNFVDYTLTSNKDITLPTLASSEAGWMCTIVNSSTRRLRIFGTTSGSRRLMIGGSIQLLFNGSGFVVLNYVMSSSLLSLTDFQTSAVSHAGTIYVDANSIVEADEVDGTVLFPYNNIQDAIDNSTDGDTIDLRGEFIITSEITLDPSKSSYFVSKEGQTIIKYASFDETNGNIFNQSNASCTKEYSFKNLDIRNAGGYGIYFKSALKVVVDDNELINNGWNGQELNTVLSSVSTGLKGYDSTQAELQAFYSGTNASNGGAIRLENVTQVEIISNDVSKNLRGIRVQDCGIGGYGFITRNVSTQNIDSGIYLASGTSGGCQNVVVAINSSSYNANNGLLCIGGLNNKFSQNEVNGNWNAGLCNWGSANLTLRDCGLYDNNRSQYNGIGNTGDAKASIQINDASTYLASSFSWNPNSRFLMEVLDTQVHYTGTGSNTQKVGFFIGEELGDIPNDDKNIIKIDDVGFIGQDYAIDFSEVDLSNLRVSLGDNSFQQIGIKTVKDPLDGNYFELPFSNHSMNINEADFSVTNTGNIKITEGVGGTLLNPYSVNELQAQAYGSDIQIVLKGSNKIQFIVPVSGCSINGTMVNSVLNLALEQINNILANTLGFASNDNPVTDFNLSGNDLTITLQDGTSFTVDVTTLGVDENKFVSSGALNGSNLELTMNDSSIITIDASNMINGSQLPAISNDWFISYGANAGDKIEAASIVATYENKQPFYNADFLNKGEEYVWTHDDNGTYILGIYSGAEETSDSLEITYNAKWSHNFKFSRPEGVVRETSVGVDVASRYGSGYAITNNTVFALSYDTDNYLKLYDISNGNRILIGQSNTALVGDYQVISLGGENQPNAKFPIMIKRYANWTIAHDFDNSETSISDGVETDTILKSNLSIGPGEKILLNFNYFGRNESIGIGYSGATSGVSNAPTNIDSRLFYNSAELIRAVSGNASGGIWTWNTSASKYYDPNGDGSNVGYLNGTGLNLGLVSFRYQSNNVLEFWHETNDEKIATLTVALDGFDINIYVGFNEDHPYDRIPSISKQTIGQGSQPTVSLKPDMSDQSFSVTEGTAFSFQIEKDAGSVNVINQYAEFDAPNWAVLDQATGILTGTAPSFNGSTDSYDITCRAYNAGGGHSDFFTVTINVEEIVYTNTKSLQFRDGASSFLGGNAALITSLERSGNGSGSDDAATISILLKPSSSNQGQTLFYFGGNDTANAGHIELKQTNHNGLKRLRFRIGTTNNYLQFTTPSGSIDPTVFQRITVVLTGGETGSQSTQMSSYYSTVKIYINENLQTTSNTHSNFGYTGSIIGENFRIGKYTSGNYARNVLVNQLTIWDSDQSSNIVPIYNNGIVRDVMLLSANNGGLDANYEEPDHHYEFENSTSLIQDLAGNCDLLGYNFNSATDLVSEAPPTS